MHTLFFATVQGAQSQIIDKQVENFTTALARLLKLPATYTPLIDWGTRITGALLLLLLITLLARRERIQRMIEWLDAKIGVIELRPADRNFFATLFWSAIWLAGLLVILYALRLTALLATVGLSAGVLTTIAAFANRELLGNVFAGFVLQARGQVAPGDQIQILGINGTIVNIGLTAILVESVDGTPHFVPNAKILNEVLINYTQAKYRREEIIFQYDSDECNPEDVEAVLHQVLARAPGQCKEKPGFFRYGLLNEKGQEMKLYVYFAPAGWAESASTTRRMLQEIMDAHGVQVGVPQQLCLFVDSDAPQTPPPNEPPPASEPSKKSGKKSTSGGSPA